MIPFILRSNKETGESQLCFHFGGKQWFIPKSHANYTKIAAEISATKHNEKALEVLLTPLSSAIKRLGKVTLEHGQVMLDGVVLNNAITKRIEAMVTEGFDVSHMIRFLQNLLSNPSEDSISELYDFLAHNELPITDDGHFLAYKGVREDFKDQHSGTFDNSPGQVHEIPRDKVDPDRERQCSYGFHVGAHEYAKSFAPKLMQVKVNPRDAVAVPRDHNFQKLRVCRYEVLKVYDREVPLGGAVYTADGSDKAPDAQVVTADDVVIESPKLSYKEHLSEILKLNRDEVVAAARAEDVIPTKEVGRQMGKVVLARKLARHRARV